MKGFLKSFVTISALSSLVAAPIIFSGGEASAQTKEKGTDAVYIGGGVSAGVTNGGQNGDAATFGGNFTGRVPLGKSPFSARTQINFSDQNAAIIPHLTVDAPVAGGTNVYGGVGYQFAEKKGRPTPSGNDNGVAVVVGVEREVGKNVLIYTNATAGINAYRNSPASALSIQGGLGWRVK
jgi:hypothetical protein